MTGRSAAAVWAGIGLCAAGAAVLVVGGVLNVDAADPWASVAGGVAGLMGLALTVYALFRGSGDGSSVTASGVRSVAAGGSIGAVATGDGSTVPAPDPPAPSSGASPVRNVTASGDRSIAAGGDIGTASTGDA